MSQRTAQPGKRFVGVISDTHGLVRPGGCRQRWRGLSASCMPEILAALRQSSTALAAIAPVVAVRGNNDQEAWAAAVPETAIVEVDGLRLYVLHDVKTLGL